MIPRIKSKTLNHLKRGSSLSIQGDSDVITSLDNSFTCGFYEVGTNAFGFGIWFTQSSKIVVWMANRDKPVNDLSSSLSLRRDGTMVLTDIDGSMAWQTNTSSTDVDRVELLETRNLVLKNLSGSILWQSFDFLLILFCFFKHLLRA
ncbi:hypothetical protein ACSBR2_032847 [Camellia fascicularis]